METEIQTSTSKVSPKEQVESSLTVAGVVLAVVYGLGFLILSLHDAKFGILEVDPFRARIFQVGFLFVCLLVLPVAAMHYGFTHYVGLDPIMQPAEHGLERRRKAILLSAFIFTAWLMGSVLGPFLVEPAPSRYSFLLSGLPLLVALVFFYVSFSAIAKQFPTRANRCLVLAFLSTALFWIVLDSFGNQSSFALSSWFFGVGVVGFVVRDSENLLKECLHWLNWLLVLLLLGVYATDVYARIDPKYGGGAPIPVVIYLDRPLPWESSKTASTALLDETSSGYFVIAPAGHNAVFIPRSDVSAIYFGPSGKAPKVK